MRALFHAEGEGLGIQEIQTMCMTVTELLTVLELSTDILIDNHKQVSRSSFRIPGRDLWSKQGLSRLVATVLEARGLTISPFAKPRQCIRPAQAYEKS